MQTDDDRKKRLSVLCKRLRGDESLRSFTKKNSKRLQGISHASWSVWERGVGDLSRDSLERLVAFIGCSYKSFLKYLNGSITLEELLQPSSPNIDESQDESNLSPDGAVIWMQSLPLKDQLFIVSQGFQSFEKRLDRLVEEKAKELIEQEKQQIVKGKAEDLDEEVAQEIAGERAKLLVNLLSGESYPDQEDIEEVAQKLNLSTEELEELCDRLWRVT